MKHTTKTGAGLSRKTLLIILLIAFALVILALLLQLGVIDLRSRFSADPVFQIRDECSIIVGKLIHVIEDEGVCRLKCRAECEVRDAQFEHVVFVPQVDECHECNCYCT